MQNQTSFSADDRDVDDDDNDGLDQHPHEDYYDDDQYDYLQEVQPPPPSPGGSQGYLVGTEHQHHHPHQQEEVIGSVQGAPPDSIWAQDEQVEAYLNVETGEYHLPHSEELMLPTADGTDPTTTHESAQIVLELANLAGAARSHGSLTPPPLEPYHHHRTAHEQPHKQQLEAESTRLLSMRFPSKQNKKPSPKRSKDGGETTYVLRIHEMLDDVERKGRSTIVGWRSHGRAFKIFHEEEFVRDILPHYFSAKIGSFRRWLRAWGFCRITEGKDRGSWYHRYFVRGVTRLCRDLSRQQMVSAMVGWPPGNLVPNFYDATNLEPTLSDEDGNGSPPLAPPAAVNNINPRMLRGTILEDLRLLLDDAEAEGNLHIASWQPHGKAFKIHNRGLFEGIMPRYFRTSLLSNLTDTLRTWGFRRLRQPGPDKNCFFHTRFVRGHQALTRHVPREEMRKAMEGFPPPEGEPDLEKDVEMMEDHHHPVSKRDPAQTSFPGQKTEQLVNHQDPTYTIPYYYVDQGGLSGDMKEETSGSSRTYVMLLHDMLDDAEKEGNTDVVCWMPHGRAWAIKDEKEFAQKIMPRYFNAQMKSFLRWCRAWGFVRMTEGKDRGAWFHRYFIRGATSLCNTMSRPQMLKSMENWLPTGHCPDFYSIWTDDFLSDARPQPTDPPPNVTTKNPKRLRGTVPEDLRQMLEEAQLDGNTSIVAWCKHGRAFAVLDKAAFTDQIMPRYFKASKFAYFSDAIRQWGFRRFRCGPDKGAFYHKLFLRGQPELTRHLTRIQMNESMISWQLADGEPNLHDLPPIEHTEQITMDDDDNNGPPLDADAIIAAAEQSVDIPTERQSELPIEGDNGDLGLDSTSTQFEMVGI